MEFRIERLTIQDAPDVFSFVLLLLHELGSEGEELGELADKKVLHAWQDAGERFQVFAAKHSSDQIAGIMTVMETFAIYANGNYGIINEMYIVPEFRSSGIGTMLIDAAKAYGRNKGWSRIDVTAPETEGWERTRRFYEKQGFIFTGPKMKFMLK